LNVRALMSRRESEETYYTWSDTLPRSSHDYTISSEEPRRGSEVLPSQQQQIINTTPGGNNKKKRFLITLGICIVPVVITLIVLAVLFLDQRPVTFDMMPIQIDNSSINVNPNGFTLPINPTVTVLNENFFPIYLDQILVNGYHPLYANGSVAMGTGETDNIFIPSRSNSSFNVTYQVQFSRANDPKLTYFMAMLTNCSSAQEPRSLYFDAEMNVQYHVWAKSGSMAQSKQVIVECPLSVDGAQNILNLVQSMQAQNMSI
jgi:hypothetical protein